MSTTDVERMDMEMTRLQRARAEVGRASGWCTSNRMTLTVSDRGHLWVVTRGERRAEWWPMKAKLVLDGRGRRARHAPDWAEVQAVLNALWNAPATSSGAQQGNSSEAGA